MGHVLMFLFQLHYKAIMCEVTSNVPTKTKNEHHWTFVFTSQLSTTQQGISDEKLFMFFSSRFFVWCGLREKKWKLQSYDQNEYHVVFKLKLFFIMKEWKENLHLIVCGIALQDENIRSILFCIIVENFWHEHSDVGGKSFFHVHLNKTKSHISL